MKPGGTEQIYEIATPFLLDYIRAASHLISTHCDICNEHRRRLSSNQPLPHGLFFSCLRPVNFEVHITIFEILAITLYIHSVLFCSISGIVEIKRYLRNHWRENG
jgi:hypothetical protein